MFVGQCQPWWCQPPCNPELTSVSAESITGQETRRDTSGFSRRAAWEFSLSHPFAPGAPASCAAIGCTARSGGTSGVWWSMVEYGGVWWSMVVWGADRWCRWCRWCVLISKIANKTSYISSIKLLPESMWIISNTSPTPPTRNKIGPLQGLTLQRLAAAW